jgi:hypothetical protein
MSISTSRDIRHTFLDEISDVNLTVPSPIALTVACTYDNPDTDSTAD